MKIPTPLFLKSLKEFSPEDIIVVGLQHHADGLHVFAPMLEEKTRNLLTQLANSVEADGSRDSSKLWEVQSWASEEFSSRDSGKKLSQLIRFERQRAMPR